MDTETIHILLDLLNPLHGSLDRQMYVDKPNPDFDPHPDDENDVIVTAKMERDLTQAVCILEDRKRQSLAQRGGKSSDGGGENRRPAKTGNKSGAAPEAEQSSPATSFVGASEEGLTSQARAGVAPGPSEAIHHDPVMVEELTLIIGNAIRESHSLLPVEKMIGPGWEHPTEVARALLDRYEMRRR